MDIKGASRDLKRFFLNFFVLTILFGELVCNQLSIDFLGPDLDLQFEFRV
jgi:hypothetical protein